MGSSCSLRRRIPVVQNISRVLLPAALSPRILYPTSESRLGPPPLRSSETRCATPVAARRRGCVQTIFTEARL
eukprot:scaffold1790_cov257-Pinguiococcus_pyrenoidosus.AAC.35